MSKTRETIFGDRICRRNCYDFQKYENAPFVGGMALRELPRFLGVCVECRYHVEWYSDDLFAVFGILCPSEIRRAETGRKAAFLAGRIAAQSGLELIGAPQWDVGTGAGGEPIWPPMVRGSISHSSRLGLTGDSGVAVCALSREQGRVGVDVERLISYEDVMEIGRLVLTPKEQNRWGGCSDEQSKRLLFTITFSAKECLYKALYREVKAYFDFQDVEAVCFDCFRGQAVFRLRKSLTTDLPVGSWFGVFWLEKGEEILTYHCSGRDSQA